MIRPFSTRLSGIPVPRVTIIGFGLVLGALSGVSTAAELVVPRESVWTFDDTGMEPPGTWTTPAFDDSSWNSGPGPLGYNETYIATTVSYGSDPLDKHITTYFRYEFDVATPPESLLAVTVHVGYEDGVVLYLNGQEILRLFLPQGPIDSETEAYVHECGQYETWSVPAAIPLLQGTGNVLAAEIHQSAPWSSDLSFDLEVEVGSDVSITRGPYLQIATPTSMTLRWRTDIPTDSEVGWTLLPAGAKTFVSDPTVSTEHTVTVTGLTPATSYYYSVGKVGTVLAGDDSEHRFRTSPTPGSEDPVRVWVIGDSGLPGEDQKNVRDAYASYTGVGSTDLWLMLGDNAYLSGSDVDYQGALFNAYPSFLRSTPLWPTRGNHDEIFGDPDNDYYDVFELPTAAEAGGVASGTEAYYSFDYANVHFVCLDSQGSDRSVDGPMLTWLRQDLNANTADWTILFWHHPPYTRGSHDSDDVLDSDGRMFDMRENVLPVADSLGVDLVMSGHSHGYERSMLIDGHYDVSSTFDPSMIVDGGDGNELGDGAYAKAGTGPSPGQGVVYVVAGSSSRISGGPLDHPVMVVSEEELGSVVLDVAGDRLDVRFLDDQAAVRDWFTIRKGVLLVDAPVVAAPTTGLRLQARPNPSAGAMALDLTLASAGKVSVRVLDVTGRVVRRVLDAELLAGSHQVTWDGRDNAGRAAAAGVFFVVLESGGERRAVRVVRIR